MKKIFFFIFTLATLLFSQSTSANKLIQDEINFCKTELIHPDDPRNLKKNGKVFTLNRNSEKVIEEIDKLVLKCSKYEKQVNLPEFSFGIFRLYNIYSYLNFEISEKITAEFTDKSKYLANKIINLNDNFYNTYFIASINTAYYSSLGITDNDIFNIFENLTSYDYFELGELEYLYYWVFYQHNFVDNGEPSLEYIKKLTKCANFTKKKENIEISLLHNQFINECAFLLAYSYDYGLEVDKDESKALKYYNKSGSPRAQYYLTQIQIYSQNIDYEKLEKKLVKRKIEFEKKINSTVYDDILKKRDDYESLSTTYTSLAHLKYDSGDYKKSFEYVTKSEEFKPKTEWYRGPNYLNYLNNINIQFELLILNADSTVDNDFYNKDKKKKIKYIEGLIKVIGKEQLSYLYEEIIWVKNDSFQFLVLSACVNVFPEEARCLNGLGLAYSNGYGVAKDSKLSKELYLKSHKLGNSAATNNLGYVYQHGGFEEISYDKAKMYYEESIKRNENNYLAYNNLGTIYQKGLGVKKNLSQAINLFKKASDLGHLTANLHLGEIYYNGDLGNKDCEEAMDYLNNTVNGDPDWWQAVTGDSYDIDKAKALLQTILNDNSCNNKEKIGKNFALLIGLQNYEYFPKLRTPFNDIEIIAKILRKKFNYTVKIVKDGNRINILKEFEKLRKKLSYNDSLLIYYAGHGEYDEEIGQSWWIPIDGEIDSDINYISTNNLTKKLKKFKAKKILMVSDSCFSGSIFRGTKYSEDKQKTKKKDTDNEITRLGISSGGDEPVLDSTNDMNNSIFAYSFFETLKENEELNSTKLFYLVQKKSKKIFKEFNLDQNPEFSTLPLAGHVGGNYYFTTK